MSISQCPSGLSVSKGVSDLAQHMMYAIFWRLGISVKYSGTSPQNIKNFKFFTDKNIEIFLISHQLTTHLVPPSQGIKRLK